MVHPQEVGLEPSHSLLHFIISNFRNMPFSLAQASQLTRQSHRSTLRVLNEGLRMGFLKKLNITNGCRYQEASSISP
jgi:hypothetical protein